MVEADTGDDAVSGVGTVLAAADFAGRPRFAPVVTTADFLAEALVAAFFVGTDLIEAFFARVFVAAAFFAGAAFFADAFFAGTAALAEARFDLAHRLRCASPIALRASALIVRFLVIAGAAADALLVAAAADVAADAVLGRLPGPRRTGAAVPPANRSRTEVRRAISSFN